MFLYGNLMINKEFRYSLSAISSGFLYGFIGYFGLGAIHGHMSVSTMLFWRFLIASIVILILILPNLKNTVSSAKNLFFVFLIGAFHYGLSAFLYFESSQYIGSGLGMVIFYTYPVLIMLLNYFFYKQYIPRLYYLAIVIILLGMMFLIDFHALSLNLWGIILGVASAFFYACYIISSKTYRLPPHLTTLMVCLGCTATSFCFSLCTHSLVMPQTLSVWYHLFGISLIATVCPILLLLYSLNYLSAEKASILSVLEPVFVVILGVLLLDEQLSLWNVLGIILILSGALITLFSQPQQSSSTQELEKLDGMERKLLAER